MPAADAVVVVLWFHEWDTSPKRGIGSAAPAGLPGENGLHKAGGRGVTRIYLPGTVQCHELLVYSNDCSHLIMLRTTLIRSYFSFFLGCFVQSYFFSACRIGLG